MLSAMRVQTIRGYVEAAHAAPTVAVTAVTGLLALDTGRGPAGIAWAATAMLAGQLSVGWSNDWVDRGDDRAAGRSAKPLVRGDMPDASLLRAAAAALLLALALSFGSGWRAAAVHAVALAAAWSYNFRLKRTALSAVPFLVAFGLLPAFVVLGLPGHPWPAWWLVAAGALLGASAHFVNVLPDLGTDARLGIRGLPQRLGGPASALTAVLLLSTAAVVLAVAPPGPPGAPGWVGLAVGLGVAAVVALVTVRGGDPRLPFRLCLAVAAADVVLLVLR
ncbi:MAG: UbiA prenyltransferase [Frankiales bacterium]|nr:UbiA prenyltransferase [Frankiales bacterium]